MLRRRTRKASPELPRTVMGRIIRSNTLRLKDDATFRDFVSELRDKGEIHSTALIEEIFPIVMRQMIREPHQVAEIPTFVEELHSLAGDHLKPHETELLIRHALGQDVSIEGIDPRSAGMIMSLTFMRLADIVRMTGGDVELFVNSAIIEAEAELDRKGISQVLAR